MEQAFRQLASLLSEEAKLYEALSQTLSEETRALVANDTSAVLAAARRKDTLALQIRSIEESRALLVDKFARAMGRPGDPPRLSQLCAIAPEPARAEMTAMRERLRASVERVAEHNDRNRQLVENSLKLIEGTMDALRAQLSRSRQPAGAANGYGPAGYGRSRRAAHRPNEAVMISRQV